MTNVVGAYDEVDPRFDSWKTPAIVALAGNWVGDLPAMPVLTGGLGPANSLKMSAVADAMLYVGPRDSLTAVNVPVRELENSDYGKEINRRLRIQMGRTMTFALPAETPQFQGPAPQRAAGGGVQRFPQTQAPKACTIHSRRVHPRSRPMEQNRAGRAIARLARAASVSKSPIPRKPGAPGIRASGNLDPTGEKRATISTTFPVKGASSFFSANRSNNDKSPSHSSTRIPTESGLCHKLPGINRTGKFAWTKSRFLVQIQIPVFNLDGISVLPRSDHKQID